MASTKLFLVDDAMNSMSILVTKNDNIFANHYGPKRKTHNVHFIFEMIK